MLLALGQKHTFHGRDLKRGPSGPREPLGALGMVMARRSSSDGAVMAYLAKAVESRVTPEGAEIL